MHANSQSYSVYIPSPSMNNLLLSLQTVRYVTVSIVCWINLRPLQLESPKGRKLPQKRCSYALFLVTEGAVSTQPGPGQWQNGAGRLLKMYRNLNPILDAFIIAGS